MRTLHRLERRVRAAKWSIIVTDYRIVTTTADDFGRTKREEGPWKSRVDAAWQAATGHHKLNGAPLPIAHASRKAGERLDRF